MLDNHIAPSRIFKEIESSTKLTVQFESLDYAYDPGFEAMLTLTGNTEEFASVALQKMQFLKDSLFSDFTVSGITSVTEDADTKNTTESVDGKVSFSVTGLFKSEVLNYTGDARSSMNTQNLPVIPKAPVASSTESIGSTTSSQTLQL